MRPGFASMLSTFLNRKAFKYNIPAFDKLIQTKEIPDTFIIYQEQVMQTLVYAGFNEDETYSIIKAVAKKKEGVIEKLETQFKEGFIAKGNSKEDAKRVWKIIVDNSKYSFNSSHSYCVALDSLFGAYLKSHYTFEYYETMLDFYSEKKNADKLALIKNEMYSFYKIELGELKFGQDNRGFVSIKEENKINQSLLGIKYINSFVTNKMYEISKRKKFKNFMELFLEFKEEKGINKTHVEKLILIKYFSDFGKQKKLLATHYLYDLFYKTIFRKATISKKIRELEEKFCDKFNIAINIKTDEDIINLIKKHSNKETEKSFTKINRDELFQDLMGLIPNADLNELESIKLEIALIGIVITPTTKKIGDILAVSRKNYSFLFKSHKTNKEAWITTNNPGFLPKKGDIICFDNIVKTVKLYRGKKRNEYKGINPQIIK